MDKKPTSQFPSKQVQEGASLNNNNNKLKRLNQLRDADLGPFIAVERKVEAPKDINESAEDFINRFRQNLRLQRLQSIENYKQMLARGL